MKIIYSAICVSLLMLAGCSDGFTSREGKLETCVDSFATHYFNYQFEDALRFCTPESERWLVYAASNVHQADIDILKKLSQGAEIEIQDIDIEAGDTTATVRIVVRNFLRMDTIGTQGHMTKEATFVLPATYMDKHWKIRMEGLLRSERKSRD